MNAPLYQKLIQYSNDNISFHMPGHKFGIFGEMKSINLLALDATEASGLDNLYVAEGIIKEAMQELSRFYQSVDTIMLTNGSTAGILASILAVCKEGDQLLIARNCHHSVWSGLILAGVQPIYINPEYDKEKGFLTTITVQQVADKLEQYPDVKGLIMVSPTYEGVVGNIKQIGQVLHKQDKILIVDEAHGAHFIVDDYFPMSALQLGADLVIHSMHKTLPTLTQSALLHIGSERIEKEKIMMALRMIQTSSPSYMMMGTMDYIRAYIEDNIENIQYNYIEPLKASRAQLSQLIHLKLLEYPDAYYDKSKIIIGTQNTKYSGYELAEILENKYQLICEAAAIGYITLMSTMADSSESLNKLVSALFEIDKSINYEKIKNIFKNEEDNPYNIFRCAIEIPSISCRTAYYGKHISMPINKCEGRIVAENIMMYPPGIPILCIGESITKIHIKMIEKWKDKLQGIYYEEDKIMCKILEHTLR